MIEKLKDWTLPDWLYNIAKWLLITVVPATIFLINGLGSLYNFDPSLITGTISLVAATFGAVLGISTINYNKKTGNGTGGAE